MMVTIEYLSNRAIEKEIAEYLSLCDADFLPPLSSRVEINGYAKKIISNATRFEAWSGGALIGLVAAYCNDKQRHSAYITSVSVLSSWVGRGIAANLLKQCIEYAKAMGMRQISLEVANDNASAIRLYEKSGFIKGDASMSFVTMNLHLKSGNEYE